MSVELKDRVVALEYQVAAHDKHIGILQSTSDTLKKSLDAMQRSLDQIKWLAMGALGTFVANEFGLMKALKVVFGLG